MEKQELKVVKYVYLIPISQIRPFKKQPRKRFDPKKIHQLSGSISGYGQQETIKVRRIDDPVYKFELIDGERRFRAAKEAGKEFVEGIIIDVKDEKEQRRLSIMLNFGKEKHDDLETADAVKDLHNDGMTQEEIATMLGKEQSWAGRYLSLSKLIAPVRDMMSPDLPKEKRLRTSYAIRVSKMSPEFQLQGAKLFLSRGAKEADRIIRAQAKDMGIKTRTERSPKNDFWVLQNFVRRLGRELQTYVELPQSFYDATFRHRSEEDPVLMVQDLRRIEETIPKLVDLINEALRNKKQTQVAR